MALNILDVITSFERTADQFLSKEEFKRRLKSRKPQRVKYTIDVKTDDLHIGHAVNLWLIRRLQDLGHKAVIVFTDFTSRIADKEGHLETIARYPENVLDRKIRDLTKQACLILRDEPELLEVRRNSEWYATMSVQDLMNVFSLLTHARLISRDTFQMRIAEGKELYISEMLYPLLQAYDSYRVMSDVAVVGTDQLFHESIGRLIQEKHKKKPQTLITTRMTPGIDGRTKQSQRRGNDISLSHSPRDKFGRVMSIPDELIHDYFRMYTDVPYADLAAIDQLIKTKPREAKARLAEAIVARYHGENAAKEEREWFESIISRGYTPDDLPKLTLAHNKIEALDLVTLARPEKSRGDSRRLIQQGGVELNGRKLRHPDQELVLRNNDVLQVGKRQWFRIEIASVEVLNIGELAMRPCSPEDIERILARVPASDLARYLARLPQNSKATPAAIAESLKKSLLQPRENEQVVFGVYKQSDPNQMLGIAHFAWQSGGGVQQFWLDQELANSQLAHDALRALGKHAFDELHLETAAIKNAFALANVPEALFEAQRRMDPFLLSREDAFGTPGFTREGWDKIQEWRRYMSPWLFANESMQSRHNKTAKKAPSVDKNKQHELPQPDKKP